MRSNVPMIDKRRIDVSLHGGAGATRGKVLLELRTLRSIISTPGRAVLLPRTAARDVISVGRASIDTDQARFESIHEGFQEGVAGGDDAEGNDDLGVEDRDPEVADDIR